MLLTAVVLGLWQLVANLEGRVVLRSLFLQVRDFQDAILVATATALAGYAIVFGDRKSAVATTVLLAALLLASGYFTGRFPRGVAVSLGLALAPLVLLRLAGFHRERIERGSDG
jgi:hypothetical protein